MRGDICLENQHCALRLRPHNLPGARRKAGFYYELVKGLPSPCPSVIKPLKGFLQHNFQRPLVVNMSMNNVDKYLRLSVLVFLLVAPALLLSVIGS